jgi:hypothetical protein
VSSEIELIGWFNGDEDNPEIVFTPPTDRPEFKLVKLEITFVPESKAKSNNSTRKLNRSLKGLVKSTSDLSKALKRR